MLTVVEFIVDAEGEARDVEVESVASEVSTGVPDWPDWQPAMVTGRELEDTDDDLPIVVHDPQIYKRVEGTGPEFDGGKHWRVVRAVVRRFPEERFSREYMSFLCFEQKIIHDRELRSHRSCWGCWELEGRALMVGRTDKRFGYRDLPDWVVGGDDRKERLEEFYRLMRFWWKIMLDPRLPYRIVDVVRRDGRWGGVQIIARRTCSFREMRQCLVGFLEEVGDEAFTVLERSGHRSLVHMEYSTVQDHKAILFGPLAYCENLCQADTRLSPCVGKRVTLGYLRGTPERGTLGLIQGVTGHWPLRLQDSPELPESSVRYRTCWKRNERVLFAYAGGRPVPGGGPGFLCDCLTCELPATEMV